MAFQELQLTLFLSKMTLFQCGFRRVSTVKNAEGVEHSGNVPPHMPSIEESGLEG